MSIQTAGAISAYQRLDTISAATETPVAESPGAAERFASIFDKADEAVSGFAQGTMDTQSVVEALSQTEMALRTAVTVRDQVVSAYQELLRMPL